MPICTILLISYNHSKFIRKSIESILEQKTDYDFIIKIFDDASSDGTQEIIKEYANKYPNKIIPYLNSKNIGAQENIWKAYNSVNTKYFALLECDDYWNNPNRLQLQINALENHPECSFTSGNTMVTKFNNPRGVGELLVTNKKIVNNSIISLEDLSGLNGGYITHISSRVVRTNSIDFTNLHHREDFLYDNCQFYYLILKGKMYYFNEIFSFYNQNNQSVFTGANTDIKCRNHLENLVRFNKNTNYKAENLIYDHLKQFLNFYRDTEKKEAKITFKKIKHYFIPRFILDILNTPRNISICIRKFLKK